jgi:GDPmannose 4,6-dehydratase
MGNLDARRDWGFAGDYVRAMWLMLQQDEPEDFVIATGETHSVEEFLDVAFGHVDLDWHDYVVQDERFMRPAEVDLLVGDPSKAGESWVGSRPSLLSELVAMMVEADIEDAEGGGGRCLNFTSYRILKRQLMQYVSGQYSVISGKFLWILN